MKKNFKKWFLLQSLLLTLIYFLTGLHFEGYESTVNYILASRDLPQADSVIYFTNFLGIFQLLSFISHQFEFQYAYSFFLVTFHLFGFTSLFTLLQKHRKINFVGKVLLLNFFVLFSFSFSSTKLLFVYCSLFITALQNKRKLNLIVAIIAFLIILCLRVEIAIVILFYCLIVLLLTQKKLNKIYLCSLFFAFVFLFFCNSQIKKNNPDAYYSMKLEGKLVDRNILPLIPANELKKNHVNAKKLLGIQYLIRDDCNYDLHTIKQFSSFLDNELLDSKKIKFYYLNAFNDFKYNLKGHYFLLFSTLIILLIFFYFEIEFSIKNIAFLAISMLISVLLCLLLLFFSFIQFQVLHSFILIILTLLILNLENKRKIGSMFNSTTLVLGLSALILVFNISKAKLVESKFNDFDSFLRDCNKYGKLVCFSLLDGVYYQPQLFKKIDFTNKIIYLDYFICGYIDYFEKHQKKIFGEKAGCLISRLSFCEKNKMVLISNVRYNNILFRYLMTNYKIKILFKEINIKNNKTDLNGYFIQLKLMNHERKK